jgi:hypothetical protein
MLGTELARKVCIRLSFNENAYGGMIGHERERGREGEGRERIGFVIGRKEKDGFVYQADEVATIEGKERVVEEENREHWREK